MMEHHASWESTFVSQNLIFELIQKKSDRMFTHGGLYRGLHGLMSLVVYSGCMITWRKWPTIDQSK